MRVRVKLFANLMSYAPVTGLPGTPFEMEFPEPVSLQNLADCLKLPPDLVKITFVNGISQPFDTLLKPGDEVGIFPPIGGGSHARNYH
jgi:sulfur-carrier protein